MEAIQIPMVEAIQIPTVVVIQTRTVEEAAAVAVAVDTIIHRKIKTTRTTIITIITIIIMNTTNIIRNRRKVIGRKSSSGKRIGYASLTLHILFFLDEKSRNWQWFEFEIKDRPMFDWMLGYGMVDSMYCYFESIQIILIHIFMLYTIIITSNKFQFFFACTVFVWMVVWMVVCLCCVCILIPICPENAYDCEI